MALRQQLTTVGQMLGWVTWADAWAGVCVCVWGGGGDKEPGSKPTPSLGLAQAQPLTGACVNCQPAMHGWPYDQR